MVTALQVDAFQRARDVAPTGLMADHNLIRTASPGDPSVRWLAEGINFVPTLCTALNVQPLADLCDFDQPSGEAIVTCPGAISFKPFIAEIAVETQMLPTVGRQEWLADRLMIGLSQAIEAIIWPGGASPGYPTLGDGQAAFDPNRGARAALGSIESSILSAKAGAGTIHMGPIVAAEVSEYLVEAPDGTLRTKGTGSKVIIGNYPAEQIAGHIGNIDLYLGSTVYQDQTFDRQLNVMYDHAWIEFVAAWHACATWKI